VPRPVRIPAFLFTAAAAAYGLDRVTKLLAERYLAGRAPVQLVPHVVQLNYTLNAGGAFGILGDKPWLFFAATVAVCLGILVSVPRVSSASMAVGLGMILGGALGNLTDRIIHGTGVSGQVVDFVDFHVWPVFNMADSAIVVGAIVVVLAGLDRTHEPAPAHGP
jgi:signal peptidase II